MFDDPEPFELHGSTWEEAAELIDRADLVALPCGSIGQHSIHLPLSVDSIRPAELTHRTAGASPTHG